MDDMRNKTCCFTGHRDIPAQEREEILRRTREHIITLTKEGVCRFVVGGAVGFDTMAAELLFELREGDLSHIEVILVYPFDGFTRGFTKEQKARYEALLPQFDSAVPVSERSCRGVYHMRDRKMVDMSAHCICCCTKDTGGTAYTVKYALKKGLNVLSAAVSPFSFDKA